MVRHPHVIEVLCIFTIHELIEQSLHTVIVCLTRLNILKIGLNLSLFRLLTTTKVLCTNLHLALDLTRIIDPFTLNLFFIIIIRVILTAVILQLFVPLGHLLGFLLIHV